MDILKTIDQMEQLIDESTKVLWTNNIIMDKNELLQIVKSIKDSIPEDVKKAKYVSQERQRIIEEAENEARLILKEADDKVKLKLSDQELFKKAKQEAEAMLTDAQSKYDEKIKEAEEFDRQIRENTWKYVTEMLLKTKKYLSTASTELGNLSNELDENINEMRGKKN